MEVLMSRRLLAALVAALFALAWVAPLPASQAKPPAKKAKKVWTNEDLEALRPGGVTVLAPARVSTAPAAGEESAAKKEEEKAEGEKKEGPSPLEKIRKRLDPLRAELGAIELQLQSLRDKRSTGNTTGQGINVTAAPGGLNTENQITQLENRRSILLRQISDIEDEARRQGIPPGALR
jgi:hypothetical protein